MVPIDVPQIALHHITHVDRILDGQRTVQPELLGHTFDLLGPRPRSDVERSRIGRHDARQEKRDEGDADKHEEQT